MEKQKTLTAVQRIEGVEQALSLLDQQVGNLTTNLQMTINAVTLLSKKVEAMINLGNSGKALNSANIAAELVSINIQELKSKVDDLKERKMAVEATVVEENSFLVGRELDPETKEIASERIQFPLFGLKQEIKDKLIGKKVGDILLLDEGRNLLEITELYNIVIPQLSESDSSSQETSQSSNESTSSSDQTSSTESTGA